MTSSAVSSDSSGTSNDVEVLLEHLLRREVVEAAPATRARVGILRVPLDDVTEREMPMMWPASSVTGAPLMRLSLRIRSTSLSGVGTER